MTERLETGPVQVPGDWPGIFIRGDNAAYYSMVLGAFLDNPRDLDAVSRAVLEGLRRTLRSCIQQGPNPPEGTRTISADSVPVRVIAELNNRNEELEAALAPFAKVVDGSRYDPRDERTLNVTGRAGNDAYKRAWHLLNNPE